MQKQMLAFGIIMPLSFVAIAQKPNWQNLDLQKDSVFGVSTEKAYTKLLKNKTAATVIVAVIDMGVDTTHEDLRSVIWTNQNEIPNNGIDDDHNGYIDDIHGWNFIGAEIGAEDIANLALGQKDFFDSLSYTRVPEELRPQYTQWKKLWKDYNNHLTNAQGFMGEALSTRTLLDTIVARIGKPNPASRDFQSYAPRNKEEKALCETVIKILPEYKDYSEYKKQEIDKLITLIDYHNGHGLNFYNGLDKITTTENIYYGDNDITGPRTLLNPTPGPFHGTHLAGIIAANRTNQTGIKGVADHTEIMTLKLMSFYRELRDQDLANSIRYAANNGAKIINLSFGKAYSFHKEAVDEAVKYAMKKDVLIIHSAGNEGLDLDHTTVFPNAKYLDGSGRAEAWIEVGAINDKDNHEMIPAFSNFGAMTVDLFAPGVNIYSTTPLSNYTSMSGTSMAAPVVAGMAALIREYYPNLTALQVKKIIMQSVTKVSHLVSIYKNNRASLVPFTDLCISGGVANVYNALLLAEKISRKK